MVRRADFSCAGMMETSSSSGNGVIPWCLNRASGKPARLTFGGLKPMEPFRSGLDAYELFNRLKGASRPPMLGHR